MGYLIRELRASTGMTQKDFADEYGIPLSTLRKWEQGEASPAPYVVSMLAKLLPAYDPELKSIKGEGDSYYYYDEDRRIVYDMKGNGIAFHEEIEGVNEGNLVIYLEDLFEGFYEVRDKFDRDLKYDKIDKIVWERRR